MDRITIEYSGSVLAKCGFRSVTFKALAEKISEKRCKVLNIIEIDGEEVKNNMSRTGAKRQQFYGVGAAAREEGKTKNLSSCVIKD